MILLGISTLYPYAMDVLTSQESLSICMTNRIMFPIKSHTSTSADQAYEIPQPVFAKKANIHSGWLEPLNQG